MASDPDFSAKASELAKFKAQEMKKYEKTVKRELNDVEDIFSQCRSEGQLKNLQERLAKSLSEVCRKAAKKQSQTQGPL